MYQIRVKYAFHFSLFSEVYLSYICFMILARITNILFNEFWFICIPVMLFNWIYSFLLSKIFVLYYFIFCSLLIFLFLFGNFWVQFSAYFFLRYCSCLIFSRLNLSILLEVSLFIFNFCIIFLQFYSFESIMTNRPSPPPKHTQIQNSLVGPMYFELL